MTDAAMLLSANRAFVIAPAGCGKTELIAQSVHHDLGHRSLVLTHTYAGVDSLRKRLKAIGAKPSSYEVDTIAGWSLRLALSFPSTSGITTERPVNEQWNDVYRAASRILLIRAIKAVVRASFDSVYVDEYQDCSPLQHDIVLNLAEIIPTRILGDPLQGIFDFGGSDIVDWQIHVRPHFDELPTLHEPHRWAEKNPTLGGWLLTVRDLLEAGRPVDLRAAPNGSIRFIQVPTDRNRHGNIQRETCMSARCRNGETLVAIHSWEPQCHKLARQSGGKFRSPETIECDDLFKAAKSFDDVCDKRVLAGAAFEFACLCLTKVKTDLEGFVKRLLHGRGFRGSRRYLRQEQIDALAKIVDDGSLSSVKSALIALARTPGAVKARYELFQEMLNALNEHETGCHLSLTEAAIRIRERTRRTGRAPGRYVVSRTLLITGLEFDHAVVLDASALDRKNLYVALTRGSRSLTVLATSPVLTPH
jgi:DNA helicase-2/ATP-dependent DNA helicase PcrA